MLEGKFWQAALDAIGSAGTLKLSEIWGDLADDIVASHDLDSIKEVAWYGSEPWTTLARSRPEIQHLLEEDRRVRRQMRTARAEYRQQRQEVGQASTEDLISQVALGGVRERRLALEELGRRGDHVVLDLAEDPSIRNAAGGIPGISRALDHLGSAAVPRARTWIAGGNPLAELSVRVLAGHGDLGDVPALLAALRGALADESWCLAELPARGLGRLRAVEATEVLVSAWEVTTHSLARKDFLAALQQCAPSTAESFTEEGLYDCEPPVQELACATALDSDSVRIRLDEIADDPLLSEVHDAARTRLALLQQ